MTRRVKAITMIGVVMGCSLLIAACASNEASHEFVTAWGSRGDGEGQFQYVEDFAFDAQGNLLVTDALTAYVQVFSPDGVGQGSTFWFTLESQTAADDEVT